MSLDFGISVAAGATATRHDRPSLHPLRITWISDPSFRYTPSYATDLRKTFERIRRQLQSLDRDGAASGKATGEKVLHLDARKQKAPPRVEP